MMTLGQTVKTTSTEGTAALPIYLGGEGLSGCAEPQETTEGGPLSHCQLIYTGQLLLLFPHVVSADEEENLVCT